jgi:hypothetical protein
MSSKKGFKVKESFRERGGKELYMIDLPTHFDTQLNYKKNCFPLRRVKRKPPGYEECL